MRKPHPQKLAQLLQPILAPAMQHHGMATAQLITHWAEVVGPQLAALSRPLRIQWPRRVEKGEERAQPGTLYVLCDGAVVLDLQHQTAQILQRVNALYGWAAISKINIRQGRVRGAVPEAAVPAEEDGRPLPPLPGSFENENLKKALQKLGRSVQTVPKK